MNWIRQLRHQLSLSQAQLARALDTYQSAISMWERGVAEPPPEMLEKLRALQRQTDGPGAAVSALPLESLGGLLRQGRELTGLTQAELAELLGVSAPTISQWERGATLPSDANAERIRAFLEAHFNISRTPTRPSPPASTRSESRQDEGEVEGASEAESLVESLRARRSALGLSREAVAEAMGVSAQSISNWEHERSRPSAPMRRRLRAWLEGSRTTRAPGRQPKEGKKPKEGEGASSAGAGSVVSAPPPKRREVEPTPTAPSLALHQAGALEAMLEALTSAPAMSLARYRLALSAWHVALQERFDELLCLAQLQEVQHLDYQIETVSKVLRRFRGRAMLSDEVGLGKTIEASMVLLEFQLRNMARQILVIVPAALVGQWREELEEKFGVTARATTDPEFRADPEEAWSARDPREVIVASLQLVRSKRHAPHVRERDWDLVIVDEAHHIKNRNTAGYRLVDALRSRYLLLLTATPVENSLEELYNLVTLLKPGQLSTLADFKERYVSDDPFSPRNRERLRELLSEVMIRNTRALAGRGIELPPRFARTIVVDPHPAEAALYEAVLTAIQRAHQDEAIRAAIPRMTLRVLFEEAGSSARAVLATLERMEDRHDALHPELQRIQRAAARAAAAASTKIASLLDLVTQARRGGSKIVVFTRFRATLEALAQALELVELPHVLFAGGMSSLEKDASVKAFRDADGVDVMLATEVGGEGRNLQFANVLINFDLPWNPMKIEQRIGRLHRIGQTRDVHVFSLCARGSAEERILEILERRIHLFELVVGEVDMILGRSEDSQEFEERIFHIYEQARDEEAVADGFEALAVEFESARSRYEQVKAFDAALFDRDFEV